MRSWLWGLLFLFTAVQCWDSEQLEVFDVVEEVKENFYEMLDIPSNSSSAVIRSAYRRLTLLWHPDKNLNEDTSEKFRNLVSVYEVLKDSKKRGYYDEVLVNGLPNWKSAMYYYRRVRKMGFMEGSIIVFSIFSIGQYLVALATYYERLYTIEQQAKPKKQKKNPQKQAPPVPVEEVPKPSVFNTLPFQIPYLIYFVIISLPSFLIFCKNELVEKMAAKPESEESEEEEVTSEPKVRRRRPAFEIPEGPTFETKQSAEAPVQEFTVAPPISGGLWTDDDLTELVQLVKKYPSGIPKRWEAIAEAIGRSVAEVTYMANKMKTNGYRMPSQDEPVVEEKVKQKTKGGKLGVAGVDESSWTQGQQKAFEDALSMYPKGAVERWDRIAELVPGKKKEECIARFKHLAASIKKQKEQ